MDEGATASEPDDEEDKELISAEPPGDAAITACKALQTVIKSTRSKTSSVVSFAAVDEVMTMPEAEEEGDPRAGNDIMPREPVREP